MPPRPAAPPAGEDPPAGAEEPAAERPARGSPSGSARSSGSRNRSAARPPAAAAPPGASAPSGGRAGTGRSSAPHSRRSRAGSAGTAGRTGAPAPRCRGARPAAPPPRPSRPPPEAPPRRVAPVVGDPFRIKLRHLLLPAVPASLWLARQGADHVLVFAVACLAVLPLSQYLGEATEHLAERTGPTVGGFLNATFGNAAELIIAIVALRAGLIELVKASITGSILGNLLLILGLSLMAAGMNKSIVLLQPHRPPA